MSARHRGCHRSYQSSAAKQFVTHFVEDNTDVHGTDAADLSRVR